MTQAPGSRYLFSAGVLGIGALAALTLPETSSAPAGAAVRVGVRCLVSDSQAELTSHPGEPRDVIASAPAASTPLTVRAQVDGWAAVAYLDGAREQHAWIETSKLDCGQEPSGAPLPPALARASSVPSDQHVLLQGFHWLSSSVQDARGNPSWYSIISENSQRIADSGFTLVWLPPPSDSGASEGYLPRQLYNLSSRYGSESALRTAVRDLASRGVGALADVVLNHRVGTSAPADFTYPAWPSRESVVQNDDWDGDRSSHSDTGDGVGYARDLDHESVTVQNGFKDWMGWLKQDVGFVGWRYDMVKGYAGWAVEAYNRATSPLFSVGEYWDDQVQGVTGWIDRTHPEPAYRSAAFDFPLYTALRLAVTERHFDRLKYADKAAGLIGVWSDKAVTFAKNHDLEEARNGANGPAIPEGDALVLAYAVILTHPGTPSVFWKDIYDSPHEAALRALIRIRRCYRISSSSRVYIAKAERNDAYSAYITGSQGELAVKIGPGAWSPDGGKWQPASSKVLTSGPDYAVWGDNGACPAPPL